MPIHSRPFWGVLGHIPPNDVTYCRKPKKDRPRAESRYLSHKTRIIGRAVRAGRWNVKKGQDRKKSQKGYISLICGEAPTEAMYMKKNLFRR